METIPKADCQKIGFFRKTHGVHGEVVLEFEQQFEYSVEEAGRFFIELDGLLVPFFVEEEGLRLRSSKSAIVKFDDVDTEEYAKRLVGSTVYLFNNEIIDDQEMSESGFTDFVLMDETAGEIGVISRVDDFSGNIVFTVGFKGEDLMVPFNEEILVGVDTDNKTITLRLPEGLLDV